MSFRRVLRRIAIVLLALVLALTVAHIVWTRIERGKFEQRIAALRAAKQPLFRTDLATAPVPDDQNAVKLLEKAAAWLDARFGREGGENDFFLWQSERAREEDWWTEDEWNQRYEYVASLRPYYDMIDKIPERPGWYLDLGSEDPVARGVEVNLWARDAAEYTRYRVWFDRLEQGRTARAARAAVFLVDLADRCELPFAIGHVIRQTIADQTGWLLRIASRQPGFDAALFRRIVEPRLTASIAPRGPPVQVLRAARGELLSTIRAWRDGETVDMIPSDRVWRNIVWRPLLYRDGSRMLDLHERVVRSCEVSPREAWPIGQRLRSEYGGGVRLYPVLTRSYGVTSGWVFRQYTVSTAMRRLTCAVMVILEHSQAAGAWPESLEALGGDLPADPFTGKPFIYERRGKGARIHASYPGKDWEALVEDDLAWSWEE